MRAFLIVLLSMSISLAEDIYASFDVYAMNESKLAFEIGGIVKDIKIKPSDKVKKGDILIRLDDTSEQIALKNAKNEYALAHLAYENAKSKMDKFKQVQSVIDKQSFEDISTSYKQAQLNLSKAKLNIEHYENIVAKKSLKAPYDAIIANKFTDIGQGIAPIQQAVIELFSYPEVKLLISFDEKYLDKVKVGQNYRFKIHGSNKEQNAKISLIYPSIDIKTRKIFAEIYTKDLTPGLFGEGFIEAK